MRNLHDVLYARNIRLPGATRSILQARICCASPATRKSHECPDQHGACRYCELWRGLGAACHVVRPTIWQTMVPVLADRLALDTLHQFLSESALAPATDDGTPTSSSLTGLDDSDKRSVHASEQGRKRYIVHSFSKGGFLALSATLRLLRTSPRRDGEAGVFRDETDGQTRAVQSTSAPPIVGVVFDSAPARITPHVVIRCEAVRSLRAPAVGH